MDRILLRGAARSRTSGFVLLIALLTSACAVQPTQHFADHAIEVDGDGKIVPVVEQSPSRTVLRSLMNREFRPIA
jgi:hypothetical protein